MTQVFYPSYGTEWGGGALVIFQKKFLVIFHKKVFSKKDLKKFDITFVKVIDF